MEAFAGLSRKAAGSQGRALSRVPQDAESPFDFRFCENQLKQKKIIARRSERNTLCAQSALMGKTVPLDGLSFFVCLS